MYNGGKIIIGILIFVGLVISPFLLTGEKATAKPDPKVDTPEIMKLPENERKCVESKDYMKREHMKMLNEWRDLVVRDGLTIYINKSGKEHTMSLQNTCMKCHSNKKEERSSELSPEQGDRNSPPLPASHPPTTLLRQVGNPLRGTATRRKTGSGNRVTPDVSGNHERPNCLCGIACKTVLAGS